MFDEACPVQDVVTYQTRSVTLSIGHNNDKLCDARRVWLCVRQQLQVAAVLSPGLEVVAQALPPRK